MRASIPWQRFRFPLQLVAGLLAVGAVLFALWYVDTADLRRQQADPAALALANAGRYSSTHTDNLIRQLQEQIKQNPNYPLTYTRLGAAYLQKARETGDPNYYAKAETALSRALELQPDDFLAMAQMGSLSLSRHEFAEALGWARQAQAISAENVLIYGVMGDALVELGQYQQAEETFQSMVDLRPDLSSYARVSYIRELYGDLDGAVEAMQWAVQAGGPNAENTNWVRVQLGHLYFNRGQLREAERMYQQALEVNPGYAPALAGWGRVLAARGRYHDAIQRYQSAVKYIPLPEYVTALGEVYEAAGKPGLAQEQYDLVRAIEKLAAANGVNSDLEMALFAANHPHRQDPGDVVARARIAFAARPTIYAADVLAWALYQAGDYAEARSYSEQALRLGTQDALLFFHAGMIAYQSGDVEQARGHLQSALDLNPYFSVQYSSVARETLKQIK